MCQTMTMARCLQDVWTKPWTEVTFDLSPYRGQQVTPHLRLITVRRSAHFAYAYVASAK